MLRTAYGQGENIYSELDPLGTAGVYNYHMICYPPAISINLLTMLKPFDVKIWGIIGVSLVAIIVTFVVIEQFSYKSDSVPKISFHISMENMSHTHTYKNEAS